MRAHTSFKSRELGDHWDCARHAHCKIVENRTEGKNVDIAEMNPTKIISIEDVSRILLKDLIKSNGKWHEICLVWVILSATCVHWCNEVYWLWSIFMCTKISHHIEQGHLTIFVIGKTMTKQVGSCPFSSLHIYRSKRTILYLKEGQNWWEHTDTRELRDAVPGF